jgi:hypothetical protein
MRQILLDYAKRKRAAKCGGGRPHVAPHEIEAALEALRVSPATMKRGWSQSVEQAP